MGVEQLQDQRELWNRGSSGAEVITVKVLLSCVDFREVVRVLSAAFALVLLPQFAIGQEPSGERAEIGVRLSVAKSRFLVGEPIEVRVEIANLTDRNLFVGREIPEIPGWIYSLQVVVRNTRGEPSARPVQHTPQVLPRDPKEPFVDALVQNWISLAPGYFLGTTITLDNSTHFSLGKPGRYRIRAYYTSKGMDAPLSYNRLWDLPDEVQGLPFKSWKGIAESNSVWIEVLPREPPKNRKK